LQEYSFSSRSSFNNSSIRQVTDNIIFLIIPSNPINKKVWENLIPFMRTALPNTDISITWDPNAPRL